ncbi:MAG: hypothetical protein REI09_08625 [Candidatus Dactylopiibacterium sp.]|nr:hypothetical protein [Candidatus Dactylopiibacterium sp.]
MSSHHSLMRGLLLGLFLLCCLAGGRALAAPAAGTNIGNQASATYSDTSATVRTVTSNSVITIVQQVASLTLGSNGAKQVPIGGIVSYPHTLVNTGNGNDSFTLSATGSGAFTFVSVSIYADANGDGVPDNTTPITNSGSVAAGASFNFVVVGVVPPTAVAGSQNTLTVTAASVLTPAVSASNTDVTTVSSGAVINVTKALDVSTGVPGPTARTFTLTYTNSGNSAATNLVLTDVIPSGMTYVGGSARWSGTGATVLTDLLTENQSGIVYDFGVTVPGRVTATIASVPAGASGILSFQVTVNTGAAPGATAATRNVAQYVYTDGGTTLPAANTNAVQFVVSSVGAVSITGATVPTAAQGSTVSFTNTITNTGTAIDSFDVTVATTHSFPVGTTFVLFRADGVTPLIDSNGNGTPDTGPLAPGASAAVVLHAILPAGASGTGPYSVQKTATSRADPTKSASAADVLSAITANTVDITNNAAGAGAPGVGPGPEPSPVITNTVAPGATTRFTLYIANGSAIADGFNLQASSTTNFGAPTLPPGWSVQFVNAQGTVITNTGVINAGTSAQIFADVTVPAGASAATTDLYFRAVSPISGAADVVHDAVTVSGVRSVSLTPNNSGQVYPGGSVVYRHTLTNTGNVVEGAGGGGSTLALTAANTASGFSSAIYWDQNNNGVLDASDPVVSSAADFVGGTGGASTAAGLDPGESAVLFLKVFAAGSAAVGTVDTATLTATPAGGVSPPPAVSVSNATAVIPGQLRLEKQQALDAACDGTADTAFSPAIITTGAVPGACVRYQVTATNAGVADVTNVVISDATPLNTVYHATVGAATSAGSVTAPGAGAAGTVTATVGTMVPGQVVTVTFGVRISQ